MSNVNHILSERHRQELTGSRVTGQAVAQPAQGEVESHLVELHQCTEELEKNLSGLFERLVPVTRPVPGANGSEAGACPEPVRCALTEQIKRVTNMVRYMNCKVDDQKLHLAI